MEIKKRYQFNVSFFRPGGRLYLRLAYHFRVKMMKLDKSKPYLILCNHTSNADPALVQLAFDRSIHYIAHYELITSRMGKLLNHMFGIIPTKKGKVDLGAIRESMKVAKQNGVIGLFPSGDCTFSGVESYIDDSIVKYVRLLDIDVILFRTRGLYGVDPRDNRMLSCVSTLKTTILQLRHVPAGDTVGYSRKGKIERDSVIAAIPIGYADGLNRHLGNRHGYCLVDGQKAEYVGNICMDVAMIDVTDIPCQEGDQVEIFGEHLPVTVLSDVIDTIPYEVLTAVSNRVKRIYFHS